MAIEHPALGHGPIYGLPWKMSKTPRQLRRAPMLGEHNVYVFCDVVGPSPDELQRLVDEKVIY